MVTLLKGSAFITGAASGIASHHESVLTYRGRTVVRSDDSNNVSGIGKSAALAFARHGVKCLAITDINKTGLESTRDALRAAFPDIEILPLHMDVRNTTQVRDSISATARAFGRLDIAVNNAGLGGSGDLTHLTPDEEIENVLDVNLSGVYRCQKAQLALMVEQE